MRRPPSPREALARSGGPVRPFGLSSPPRPGRYPYALVMRLDVGTGGLNPYVSSPSPIPSVGRPAGGRVHGLSVPDRTLRARGRERGGAGVLPTTGSGAGRAERTPPRRVGSAGGGGGG